MKGIRALLIFALVFTLGGVGAFAQLTQTFTIKDIIIEGLNEVPLLPVMDQITFEVGDTVTLNDVRTSAERIFNMGLFKNVEPQPQEDPDGVVLTFNLEENPVIQAIEISGNKLYQYRWDLLGVKIPFFWEILKPLEIIDILREANVTPYQIVNLNDLRDALEQLTLKYQEKGYTLFKIDEAQVFGSVLNSDILRIPIIEYIIEDVQIEGLTPELEEIARGLISLPQDQPPQAIQLQRSITALTNSIYFDASAEDSIQFQPGSLVDKVVLSLNLNPRHLTEAPTAFDSVSFEGNTAYSDRRLLNRLGQWDHDTVQSNQDLLYILQDVYDLYHESGYTRMGLSVNDSADGQLHVQIDEGLIRDLDIRLSYDKGHSELRIPLDGELEVRHYQTDETGGSLEVESNSSHTKPYVISKALHIRPGQLFNENRLRDTVRTLLDLGYFDDVQVDMQTDAASNQVDIKLIVVEKEKLGSLNGALSLSDQGLVGKLSVAEKNLFGTGQDVELEYDRGIFGPAQTNWALKYTANGFFPLYKDFSVRVFQSFERPTFDEELTRRGGELSLTYPLNSTLDLSLGGRHENFQECLRGGDDCSPAGVTDSITVGLTNDTRDNPIFPMEGGRRIFQVEQAGGFSVGTEFTKVTTALIHHLFLLEDQNLSGRLYGGWGHGMPSQEKFTLGGPGTVRGLVSKRVNSMAFLNLEYRIRWLDQFSTAIFTDWGLSNQSALLGTVGIEARVSIPLVGMTRLILAWPVNDPSYRTYAPRFLFSFGSMF